MQKETVITVGTWAAQWLDECYLPMFMLELTAGLREVELNCLAMERCGC